MSSSAFAGIDGPSPFDDSYTAKGDGISDDTLAFSAFESEWQGKDVDLLGRTVKVSAVPSGNQYSTELGSSALRNCRLSMRAARLRLAQEELSLAQELWTT